MKIIEAIKSFFKIGVVGFGGGTALIPIIEKEILEKSLITAEQFDSDMVLQGITPGAFPIKTAVSVGLNHSAWGANALAYAVSLFGGISALIITAILSFASGEVLEQIGYISVGISAIITLIIFKFIIKTPAKSKNDKLLVMALILIAFTFIFTGNSEITGLIQQLTSTKITTYIPELSTVTALMLGFNFICFTKLRKNLNKINILRYTIGTIVTVLGVLCFCENPIIKSKILNYILIIIIVMMFSIVLISDIIANKKKKHEKYCFKRIFLAIVIASAPLIIMLIVVACLPFQGNLVEFVLSGITSVITTFGGGTAYISVSEGIFVAKGMVSAELFWEQVVPIGNALPGPLLVKMLASIGFLYANSFGASFAVSVVYGVLGFVIGVTTTVVSFLFLFMLYAMAKELKTFKVLTKGIMPLIGGLLLPTLIAMITNMLKVIMSTGVGLAISGLFLCLLIFICSIGMFKYKIKEICLIIMFGITSFGMLNIFAV